MGRVELNPIVLYPIPLSHLEKVDIDIIFDFKRVQNLIYTKIEKYLELFKNEYVFGIRNGRIFSWRLKVLKQPFIYSSKFITYDLYHLFNVKHHDKIST